MKIRELFPKMKKDGSVLILGELLIDFIPGKTDMRLDQTGEIIKTVSGSAGITAAAVAGFKVPCSFIGKLGTDAFSRLSRNVMEKLGVNMEYVTTDATGQLGLAFIEYTESGRNYEYYRSNSVGSRLKAEDIPEEAFADAQVLHFPGMLLNLNENMKESCLRAVQLAKKNNVVFSFDPNLRKEIANNPEAMELMRKVISQADIIEPTLDEAKILTGKDSVKEVLASLHAMGPKIVVLTRDAKGAILSCAGHIVNAEGSGINAIDPTGAGDTFAAAMTYAVHENLDLEQTMRFCNGAASMVCMKRGAVGMALPALSEVQDFLREHDFMVKEYKIEEYVD